MPIVFSSPLLFGGVCDILGGLFSICFSAENMMIDFWAFCSFIFLEFVFIYLLFTFSTYLPADLKSGGR